MLIQKGIRFIIGNGQSVSLWTNPWLPTCPPRAPHPIQENSLTKVYELLTQDQMRWDEELIRNTIEPHDSNTILAMKICPRMEKDILVWHYNKSGEYFVKSGYWLATHDPASPPIEPPPGNLNFKNMIWKLPTAPKLNIFFGK